MVYFANGLNRPITYGRFYCGPKSLQRRGRDSRIIEVEKGSYLADTTEKTSRAQERRLIHAARTGDRCALRELIDQHKDRLFSFIRRMVRNHHDAEEICQDAFMKAFSSLDSFSTQYRFSTWLFTIGYRVSLNHLRRRRALTGEVDFDALQHDDTETYSTTIQSEEASRLRHHVWSAVDQLTGPQKAALLLFYRHDSSCKEIALILGFPVATVKSHLHRARNRLRELLEPLTEKDLQEYRNVSALAG